MKVLIVSKVHTHPTAMGNSYGILAQARMLKSLGCEIHFLYVQERGLRQVPKEEYEDILVKMKAYWGDNLHVLITPKYVRFFENIRNIYFKKFRNNHTSLYNEYPEIVTGAVSNLQRKYAFDACIVQYIYMTRLYDYVDFPKKALFTHDVMAYKNLVVGEDVPWYDASQEAVALQKCTDVFAVQEEELHYFKMLSPKSFFYDIYALYEYNPQTLTGNKNILFLSGNNEFNRNGIDWFVREVLPLIRTRHRDAKLLIAGGICEVVKGKYDNVDGLEFKGYVGDPKDFYALGDVAINPTYQGTGLKIKTFESIANDKVTLVRTHSTAGIFRKDTAPLFSSDNPQEWADYLDAVWGNPTRIFEIKHQNEYYMKSLYSFISEAYKRFINR